MKNKIYHVKDKDEITLTGLQLREWKQKIKDELIKSMMNEGAFTTSMNRKVCYDAGYEQGRKDTIEEFEKKIKEYNYGLNDNFIKIHFYDLDKIKKELL